MLAWQNELGSVPSSSIFWKYLRRIGFNSCLDVWYDSLEKPSGPGLFFVGRFLILKQLPNKLWVYSDFFISSWFSFGRSSTISRSRSTSSRSPSLSAYSCTHFLRVSRGLVSVFNFSAVKMFYKPLHMPVCSHFPLRVSGKSQKIPKARHKKPVYRQLDF